MFCVLDKLCRGMIFSSPYGKSYHRSTGLGYVDDVTLWATIQHNSDVNTDKIREYSGLEEKQVHQDISERGQNWEMMLHTNGGLLELQNVTGFSSYGSG